MNSFKKSTGVSSVWIALITLVLSSPVVALDVMLDKWYLGVFSYMNSQFMSSDEMHVGMGKDGISLGETSIFTRGKLTSRVSVLSEHTLLPRHYREDQFKLERLVVRYEIRERHWVEFGKLHTPVNYWNDWFHHGRLFFPTVDRPSFFTDKFFAIHDIGIRFSGALGTGVLQYDVFGGSGRHAVPGADGDQIFPDGLQSLNLALTYPWKNWTFRTATYLDGIRDAMPLLRLHTASVHMEDDRFRGLLELAAKFSEAGDSAPEVRKISLYQYVGYKLSESMMPYVGLDVLSGNRAQADEEATAVVKSILGFAFSPDVRTTLKTQFELHRDSLTNHKEDFHPLLIFQLAVGM